jgi:GT2 family glycosyltransferase
MANFKTSVAVIITCHNRKEKTIKCLTNLMNQTGIGDITLAIYLVDDGSTDGTSNAVRKKFTEVKIIKGDGTLFWNGGMRLGFAEAMKGRYDYFLWLNDDTFLYSDTLIKMIESSDELRKKHKKEVIVTGTIIDLETGEVNYGGRNQKSKLSPLKFLLVDKNNNLQKCDTFNGNVVLIPQVIPAEIGNISKEYGKQHNGDFDYGLRAKYAGFDTWVISGVIGECSYNTNEGGLHDTSLSLRERIKQMKSPKGVPPAKEWMIFTRRHGGLLWPYYWFRTIIRVVFPFTYLFFRRPK